VGAIIRSATAFGASGILIPAHNQAPITGIVAKASAGTVFSIPILAINNENQTILDLKKRGFWIYGLAGEGDHELPKEKFDAPAVFVVGSEGQGLRQRTREHCDILLRIPMTPRVESLNASVSAAVVLAAWATQHPEALA
jgi:23S rRNA (guanosine2251-2'-O)-methyltransferase